MQRQHSLSRTCCSPLMQLFTCLLICLLGQGCAVSTLPGKSSSGIPVLMYHQIVLDDTQGSETIISLQRFEEQMKLLAAEGYTTLSTQEFFEYLQGGQPLPLKPILLTFDDGWANVLNAVPILRRHNFKASFWIFPGSGINSPYLTWDQVRSIAESPDFDIQAHSLTHPWDPNNNLVSWSYKHPAGRTIEDSIHELTESKRLLELNLGKPVKYFAWPCGWHNQQLVEKAMAVGYEGLMTANSGINEIGSDPRLIKRLFVDGSCSLGDFSKMLKEVQYQPCGKGSFTDGTAEPRVHTAR